MRWGVPGRSIIVTSHDTLSSPDFIEKMKNINGKKMLIADEMHWLGARGFAEGLIPEYEMRLGLSATPKRWLDDEGTSILYAYFGETAYEFSLEKALTTTNPSTGRPFLTGYDYYPHFVEMTNIEMENYLKLTEKIRKASFTKGDSSEKNESLELLLIKRQKIIKNSESKYPVLSEILGKEKTSKYGLIYCTPEQIGRVQDLVNSQGIVQHKFTYRESATRRQELIEAFSRGDYNFLIAMKCLDEGVDIPATRTAIFMSSSGNPREYIQRRGRILRDCEGKTKAIVHDVIVLPTIGGYHNDLSEIEKGIVRKELTRYEYFANLARNRVDCLSMILKLKHDLGLIL
jgi:superfamily II DNA or RNA helicase